MKKIGIYLPDQFAAAMATTLFEYLQTANILAQQELFQIEYYAATKRPKSYSGVILDASTNIPDDIDVFIVVGTGGGNKNDILKSLHSQTNAIVPIIKKLKSEGALIASVCTGGFYLAASGLLNNKPATTAWWLADDFKEIFPKVQWNEKKSMIVQGKIITAGAGFTGVELAKLLLTKTKLVKLERRVHQVMLLPEKTIEQSQYMKLLPQVDNEFAKKAQLLTEKNLKTLKPDEMAQEMGYSSRTFIRKFKEQMNVTPGKWLQRKRIEKAKNLLLQNDMSVEEACFNVGYADPSSFNRLFQREVGMSPGEFRLTFKTKRVVS